MTKDDGERRLKLIPPRCQWTWPRGLGLFQAEHVWEGFAPFKRRCEQCGREEWVFGASYPSFDAPGLSWGVVHDPYPDRRWSRSLARYLRKHPPTPSENTDGR